MTSKPNPHAPYKNAFEKRLHEHLGADWQYEHKPARLKYTIEHEYWPDFHKDGAIVEGKGRLTPSERAKAKAIRLLYPNLDFTMCFSNPEAPIYKGSKTTCKAWAEKLGIKVMELPAAPKKARSKKK